MIFEVRTVEEVRYIKNYIVEAETREEAKQIVIDEYLDGEIISEDNTYFDIIKVDKL